MKIPAWLKRSQADPQHLTFTYTDDGTMRPNQAEINDVGEVLDGIHLALAGDDVELLPAETLAALARELEAVAIEYDVYKPVE